MKNLIKNHKIKAYAFYCLNSKGLSKKEKFPFLEILKHAWQAMISVSRLAKNQISLII